MKTPEGIKKGLECCPHSFTSMNQCCRCPYEISCYANKPRDTLMRDALAYIQQLEAAQPKWVSAEERLPEHLQYVLTVDRDGEMEVMYYDKEWPSCFCLWSGRYKKFNVTHWIPLPELPKEEI